MLREAGALEVHVRISSPPVKWPCFYGIDFATRAELIANGLELDGIRRSIGADTLGYVSLDGLVQATEQPRTRLCMACFDGEYPIALPAGNLIGKHLLEGVSRRAVLPVAALEEEYQNEQYSDHDREAATPLVGSPGGVDALHRP
jgi:amidophosphoribosyltransferase